MRGGNGRGGVAFFVYGNRGGGGGVAQGLGRCLRGGGQGGVLKMFFFFGAENFHQVRGREITRLGVRRSVFAW